MSGDSKFFTGVVIAAVLVVAGIVVFSSKNKQPVSVDNLDYTVGEKLGSDSAPVKIVEFGDFQCPACAAASADFRQAQQQNADKVQIIFRHFPLSQHQNAIAGAIAAEAAGAQGKFWEMYDSLYANQTQWENLSDPNPTFTNLAKGLGLDLDKFKSDLSSSSLKDKVISDRDYGTALKVDQTPTFYINKKQVLGPQTLQNWQQLINDAAASAG